MSSVVILAAAASLSSIGCAPSHVSSLTPAAMRAIGATGGSDAIKSNAGSGGDAKLTVLVFFSAHCPCQAAHDPRLRALFARYSSRGVHFVAVDSEASASIAVDLREAAARSYPFTIVSDPEGAIADQLGAEFATFTVILDEGGRVLYRGGIDSDRSHLTDDAKPWLDDALAALLDGRTPPVVESKALGCALQRK